MRHTSGPHFVPVCRSWIYAARSKDLLRIFIILKFIKKFFLQLKIRIVVIELKQVTAIFSQQ